MRCFILLLIFLNLLNSCRMVVDVDVPFEGPSIVANAHFNPDSVWSVHLTASKHILDESPYTEIDNAEVVLYENDRLLERLEHSGMGIYRSLGAKPLEGKVYQLKVSVPGMGEAQATDMIPEKTKILSGTWRLTYSDLGSEEFMLTTAIDDPAGVENYYMIEVYNYKRIYEPFKPGEPYTGPPEVIDSLLLPISIYTHDPIVREGDMHRNKHIFTDAVFDGKTYAFQFVASDYTIRNDLSRDGKAEIYIVLRSLSKSSFEYWSSLITQQQSDVFAEPMPISNNIVNGLGIFGGYNRETKKVIIERDKDHGVF